MTLRECISYGESVLSDLDADTCKSDVRTLAMYAFSLDYTGLFTRLDDDMKGEAVAVYKEYIEKRSSRYPCQYITGVQDFFGYTFHTVEGVLIPRPETELLCERALYISQNKDSVRFLDMCCGSGCIGISYARKRREQGFFDDRIYLCDISDAALSLSGENCALNGVCADIVKSDLFDNVSGSFDIIVSNPPYIKSADIEGLMDDVRLYEPALALDGGSDGLSFYRRIIKEAGDYLNDNGKLLFEIGYNQFEDIRGLLVDAGYSGIQLIKDYAGLDRIVSALRG